MSDPEDLVCFVEPDGGASWVDPTTGSALRVDRAGVYRVSRYEDGFDYDVVLGQLCPSEAHRVLGAPTSTGSRHTARDLICVLDGVPGATVARGA